MPQFAKGQKAFRARAGAKYIAFNKPFAVLTQFSPEKLADGAISDKQTLADFNLPKQVYPVGRLDFDSEGLLILSDDGRLTTYLFEGRHPRTYLVQVENVPSPQTLKGLQSGVIIGGYKTQPCLARLLDSEPNLPERSKPVRFRKSIPTAWIELTLWEGKNRQVRKMTAAVGHPTLRLLRQSIGNLSLAQLDLAPGEWKELNLEELSLLLSTGCSNERSSRRESQ